MGPPGLSPRSGTALARVGLIATYSLFWAGLSEKGLTLILVEKLTLDLISYVEERIQEPRFCWVLSQYDSKLTGKNANK